MANPFVHVELHTRDLAKAKAFYSKLFGWKLEDMPMPGGGSYTMISVGEGTAGEAGTTLLRGAGIWSPNHSKNSISLALRSGGIQSKLVPRSVTSQKYGLSMAKSSSRIEASRPGFSFAMSR